MFHYCRAQSDIPVVRSIGCDYNQRDLMGRNAMECLAYHGEGKILSFLLLAISDAEFIANATPFIWASIALPADSWDTEEVFEIPGSPIDFSEFPKPARLLVRFVNLIDSSRWEELLTPCFHLCLRNYPSTAIYLLAGYRGPSAREIRRVARQALVNPFDSFFWSAQYHTVDSSIHEPTPHVIVELEHKHAVIALKLARIELGAERFAEWIATPNARGLDCLARASSSQELLSSLRDMIENLKRPDVGLPELDDLDADFT